MPIAAYRKYLVSFTLPDGEHLAVLDSFDIKSQDDAAAVTRAAVLQLSTNPDAKLINIEPITSLNDLQKRVDELKARNPDRPLATELGMDTPNRILTNPEIPRGLAALYNPAARAAGASFGDVAPSEIMAAAATGAALDDVAPITPGGAAPREGEQQQPSGSGAGPTVPGA